MSRRRIRRELAPWGALLPAALSGCSAVGDPASAGEDAPREPPARYGVLQPADPPAPPPSCPGAPTVTRIATSGTFTLALVEGDPRVWCWGACRPWTEDPWHIAHPAPQEGLETQHAIDVCAGGEFACALLSDGSVSCWGWNPAGQLGDGESGDTVRAPPGPVPGISDAVQLGCGTNHACIRKQPLLMGEWARGVDEAA